MITINNHFFRYSPAVFCFKTEPLICVFVRVSGAIRGHCSVIQLPDLIKPSVSAWKQWMLRRASKIISLEHYLLGPFYASHTKHIMHCPYACSALEDWNYLQDLKGKHVWYTHTVTVCTPFSSVFLFIYLFTIFSFLQVKGNTSTSFFLFCFFQKSFCPCPNNPEQKNAHLK